MVGTAGARGGGDVPGDLPGDTGASALVGTAGVRGGGGTYTNLRLGSGAGDRMGALILLLADDDELIAGYDSNMWLDCVLRHVVNATFY